MAKYDYSTRREITIQREEQLKQRMKKVKVCGDDIKLAQEIGQPLYSRQEQIGQITRQFYNDKEKKPSEWFMQKGILPASRVHKGLLDAFVPAGYQESFLYMIDKLNQFSFSRGWYRRIVRTAGYGPQMYRVFSLMAAYEKLFYCGENLVDLIYQRMDEEKLDYIKNEWNFSQNFSLIYAAEIDRGNQEVIRAFEDLIYSENSAAYLDREMILGIFQSDNHKLHKMMGDLLLAARLQEGLRQVICETVDEGTKEAFLAILQVIEENQLIRYSSVQRAVSVWIGIFNENSVDRVSQKLLQLMGQCLRDSDFCQKQLKTDDAVAVSVALWALGAKEAEEAVAAMAQLIDHGTKNQKLIASYYNENLYDENLKIRTARKVILEHTDDLELVAAFMPAYTLRLRENIQGLLYYDQTHPMEMTVPKRAVLTDYFIDQEDALVQYEKFWSIYKQLPKKGVVYDPCIFPWHRVELKPSALVCQLAFTAYVLNDEDKITQMAELLGEISSNGYERGYLLNLLLYNPANQKQKELLIQYMGNAEGSTSDKAIAIAGKLSFTKSDYRLMEDMLRFKRSRLRSTLLEFLEDQDEECMRECLQRLLTDKKEEKRSAGLDLLLRISKQKEKSAFYQSVQPMAALIQKPTDKEQILIEEILGTPEESVPACEQAGYGIYDPAACPDLPKPDKGRDAVLRCMPLSEDEIIRRVKKLDALIREYKDYEYDAASGDRQLLGNAFRMLKEGSSQNEAGDFDDRYRLKNYPLEEQLRAYYEQEIGDYGTFVEWEAWILLHNAELYEKSRVFYEAVFGKMPFRPQSVELAYPKHIQDIRFVFRYEYLDRHLLFQAGLQAAAALRQAAGPKNRAVSFHYNLYNGTQAESWVPIENLRFLDRFLEGLAYWETEEEFREAFYAAYALELKCARSAEKPAFYPDAEHYKSLRAQCLTPITPYWFLKAYHMGLIGKDLLYQSVFDYFDLRENLQALCQIIKGEFAKTLNRALWQQFFGSEMSAAVAGQAERALEKDGWCFSLIRELYQTIVPVMVDTELRRGEAETVFTPDISGITYITGIPYFVRILKALGNDTLGREAYYSWYYTSAYSKKDVLSRLLKSCYPAREDQAQGLKEALESTGIKAERLVEAAMYAPQWVDLIEQCLGWKGLKSGCYYFMAHMNETFDDAKLAMIAKYTPLSADELQGGAFDIDWFKEAYGLLGEKNFGMLYKAAKYISDGQKHSRARKYADAASGKVTLEDLRQQIMDKRNKDLLMSYGLVPFGRDRDKDLIERYQFIQHYAKEARQFGAQRRASETRAAQTALVNLSVHAGFADVTRLILNMEGALAAEFEPLMQWKMVDDVEICLHVDEAGKSGILCRKGTKSLKSVPSKNAKNAYVLEVKEAHKKLKEQYVRAKKLMEESMEDGAWFTAQEAYGLMCNPVVGAILKNLVFISGEDTGFLAAEEGRIDLLSWDGRKTSLDQAQKIRIAHPLDLYRAGIWHTCQKYLFDHQICQPFRQVFRELYVKMPEELGLKASRMFAGNQIQPKKTAACLKGRRWVADYEEGLQKIYYKENIIARIYALADWFSPSDVEAPTLEWVEFSDRKTFAPLTIEQVPDLIYSEVMRDVDLAVSVAHAGGVDPQASHSTIEMRRAVVEFNLPLFGIKNVVLKESHALIHGTRGNYNVHLGSGVVHMEGGAMLNILPVHSQKRGRLFLPFVDEDPKTAEIMSKIVLLAEDKKIRDPFILQQIS